MEPHPPAPEAEPIVGDPAAGDGCARRLARAIHAPYVPAALASLEAVPGYLEHCCAVLERAAGTAGFRDSALYMADMAADAVEEVYEPLLTTDDFDRAGVDAAARAQITATLDVFHWVQPQVLLLVSALAEAWRRPAVGGRGQADPRGLLEREREHLAGAPRFEAADRPPLPEIAETLGFREAPEVYRAVAAWERYLALTWAELQHLAAYPEFRRRGRALYFYARSSSRFLAEPLVAPRDAFMERGGTTEAAARIDGMLSTALPALATAMMHTCALRVALGVRSREVVRE